MKKIWLIALVLLVVPVQAAWANTVVRTGDSITIAENQTVEGAFYALGGSIALSGLMEGDTTLAGGNVTVNGAVGEDLFVLGGAVTMHASVTEDVRIIAGNVTISEPVGGSLVVVAGRLTVLSTATIAGDVLMYGGEATIDGAVAGTVMGNTDRIRINGVVGKGVDVTTRHLTLGEQADITGDVQYVSVAEAVRAPGAVVTGSLQRNDVPNLSVDTTTDNARTIVIMFLMSLFATLSLYLLFKRPVEQLGEHILTSFGLKTLLGFAALFLAPIAVIILLVSVLGVFIGLIGLFVFFLAATLALALMNVVCGSLLAYAVVKEPRVSVVTIIAGAISVQILLLIPVVGAIVCAFLFLSTLGALVWRGYTIVR